MLETRLVAVIRGRRFFEVCKDTQSIFTGSLAECRRFAKLHLEKELKSRRNKRRRDKPAAKIFRVWARGVSATGA